MYVCLYVAYVDVRGAGGHRDQQLDESEHGHHKNDDQLLQVRPISDDMVQGRYSSKRCALGNGKSSN